MRGTSERMAPPHDSRAEHTSTTDHHLHPTECTEFSGLVRPMVYDASLNSLLYYCIHVAIPEDQINEAARQLTIRYIPQKGDNLSVPKADLKLTESDCHNNDLGPPTFNLSSSFSFFYYITYSEASRMPSQPKLRWKKPSHGL